MSVLDFDEGQRAVENGKDKATYSVDPASQKAHKLLHRAHGTTSDVAGHAATLWRELISVGKRDGGG
jgi:hypothetical protein